ncbi:ATP-dependent nuclease [Flavonifractor sp. An9]|uniref:ATP-dependent nuclease n=1 Tax=Flavonifractor sp. An9 TaxID=1965664 RepID=UPI000B385C01|nr:AAA family ATPase [Flavonifractor sp. An9]OUN12737.1 hypothetical protein B5G40_03535 [Flavonifractor sp. An9]
MLLSRFRVTEFRSVQDSGWIDAEQITALIGTNESGKTNVMLPLWKLNPAADGEINLQDDLPRDKYHVYRNAEQKPIFIRAQYSLNGDEQAELAKIIRCDPTVLSAVIVERDFDGNYSYIFPNEPEHKNEEDSFVDIDGVTEYIASHMPKYVYYSNYGNLDSQIYLPAVLQNMNRTDLGIKEAAKARTLSTLFKYVNLDPKEITDMGAESSGTPNATQIEATANKKKEREILLSSAAAGFTKSFNEWWKQGNYIFEFKADGNYFRIWVSDSIRPEPIELEARSTGLQWFFSFYLVFLVESELHHRNAILLLDEPGVTLHPLAQKDLFTFFENLSLNNQIIYTTHSPFMVDSNHLERVRSVYIDTLGKTTVSADLRAAERLKGKNQPQSIYPAHAALGLSVSDTLLINCNPVLVEGESDQLYLSALKNLLISKGKIAPLKEIVFIPTGGVKGIKATSAILSGVNDIKPLVVIDGDKPGTKMANELKADFYAAETEKLISIADFSTVVEAEVEDLFPKSKLAKIVARFLPRPEEADEEFDDVVVVDKPICNQIEEFAKAQGIDLGKGWKVRLAAMVKREILKGTDKVIGESDPEFAKVLELFNCF